MKFQSSYYLQLFFLFSFSVTSSQTLPEFNKVPGFSHPESVVLDRSTDFLFVSSMGEKVAGDGFISKVSMEGKIIDTIWVAGLEDPKGLLVMDGKLFVADNTRIIEMDIESGLITEEISVRDAVMLNDIAADEEGNLYISDTGKNSVYKLDTEGNVSEWLNSEELESPNGLLFRGKELWVAAWGNGEEKGNILKIDPETKKIRRMSASGIGNLDGLQQSGGEELYFSDWATGNIHKIDTLGNTEQIVTSERSVGDILLLEEDGLLILPMNLQNEVWWHRLDK